MADGAVDEETVELLGELISPRHEQDDTLIDGDYLTQGDSEEDPRQQLPWWKRPSPWWLLCFTPLGTIAMSATMAPKVEIYTLLACSVHKPDIFRESVTGTVIVPVLPNHEGKAGGIRYPPSFDIATKHSGFHADTPALSNITLMAKPKPSPCASDPVVQAAVAKLTTAISASMGVLGCLTTGWWGSFSDRHGRTRIIGLSVLGLLLTDFNFIFVAKNYEHVPGGYWFLIVGPIIEGALGGFSSASAAIHAYLADTTSPSRVFSLFLGLVFGGMGLGPTLGGLLVRFSHSLLSVFYLATTIHALYALFIWLLCPESLTKLQMQSAAIQYTEALRLLPNEQDPTLLFRIKSLFSFLKPMTIFFPVSLESSPNFNPLKGRKRDWNLTLLAAAYGFTLSIMGSLMFKFQYAIATFGWNSEYTYYKRPRSHESDPLLSDRNMSPSSIKSKAHSPAFDLGLARFSLFIEVIAYTMMPFASTGFSVALELYSGKGGLDGTVESGKLFGALSVVQALCSQILGPSIYGLVYVKTVATFPKAIFFVSIGSVVVSFICLSLVSHIPDHGARDATLVNVNMSGDGELRGRKDHATKAIPEVIVTSPN
ncbi:hypothetical protein B0H10DRAFT_2162474 [Mycena sp. CBHHK59/15]|nr:hypothetical protein B0H10DRAFT_2162474 [Mycena sp. CBHHK59/15]